MEYKKVGHLFYCIGCIEIESWNMYEGSYTSVQLNYKVKSN